MKKTQKGDTMILSDFFQQHPQAAIGFSGGVDSSYLAYCAKKYAQNILAIYYKSEFQPEFEFEDAKRFCTQHGIPLKILYGSVLHDDTIIDNPEKIAVTTVSSVFFLPFKKKPLHKASRFCWTVRCVR